MNFCRNLIFVSAVVVAAHCCAYFETPEINKNSVGVGDWIYRSAIIAPFGKASGGRVEFINKGVSNSALWIEYRVHAGFQDIEGSRSLTLKFPLLKNRVVYLNTTNSRSTLKLMVDSSLDRLSVEEVSYQDKYPVSFSQNKAVLDQLREDLQAEYERSAKKDSNGMIPQMIQSPTGDK